MAQKKKKGLSLSGILIIVGLLIILIPTSIWLYILWDASTKTHEPIVGDRFEGDLEPAITTEELTDLNTRVKSLSNVDDVQIDLKTATLRIYIDASDEISKEELTSLVEEGYEQVNSVLPIATYFTTTSNSRMYDLEIHGYNSLDYADSDQYIYVQVVKNSMMDNPETQVVSDAKDQELVDKLTAEETPEITADPNDTNTTEESQETE